MTSTSRKAFKKDEILIREGEAGDCAYVIESGVVEILVQKDSSLLRIGTRGAGSIIGEMAMVDDKPRTATIRALEDCQVLEISRGDFSRHVDAADPVLKMVMRVIMTRFRDLMSKTASFSLTQIVSTAEETEKNDAAHSAAIGAIKIDTELREAIEKNQLLLNYQPIIDVQNMKIAGFEALMRWKHPEKGLISPGVFIPLAEESGLIADLSKWALAESCDAIKSLTGVANKNLLVKDGPHISVNFSVRDFSDPRLFEQIEKTLTDKNVPPGQIHLEITESLLMDSPEAAKGILEKCRQLGIHISIDDFGSGYSSLSYLHYFPIDTMKIDRNFIRSMTSQPTSLVLVKSIIALAKNLQMKVVAEGIETEEEARLVRDLGCDLCQGYWFSKPLSFDDAKAFIQFWQPPKIR